jgi:hypothetical protein
MQMNVVVAQFSAQGGFEERGMRIGPRSYLSEYNRDLFLTTVHEACRGLNYLLAFQADKNIRENGLGDATSDQEWLTRFEAACSRQMCESVGKSSESNVIKA